MLRHFRTLLIVGSIALLPVAGADGSGKNVSKSGPSLGTTKGGPSGSQKTITTISNNKLNLQGTGNGSTNKTFPKLNTYQPKVNKKALDKLGKKDFDKDYHKKFAEKHDYGYCYHGKDHCHWSYCCWDDCCGCYFYYCPCTCVYYYYCVPDCCFYPVTYVPYCVYFWPQCYVVPEIPCIPCESVVPQ
jgi:hypothetical protein